MAPAPQHDMHTCSICSKPATHTCKACKATPNTTDGQLTSTWYCGAECQKAHWTKHKVQCKAAQARQKLYRAGDLAQKIFYHFSKTTYMWCPWRIEKIGTTWLLHPIVYDSKSQLVPFPYATVPNVQDQEALLSYQRCSSAVYNMQDLVKALLEGLYSKIDEVRHYVKGAKYHLRRVFPNEGVDGTDYTHTITRVTMKDGSTYVLDVTGAQYGWHEYVMPWQSYNISRIREVLDVRPFGGTTLYWKSKTTELGGLFQWRVGITDCFALEVTGAVVWWQRHNISLNTLLRLPEHEFLKNKASLLNRVDDILQRSKAFRESRGYFEVNGGFKHGAERANDRIETGMEFTLLRDEFRGSWDTMSG